MNGSAIRDPRQLLLTVSQLPPGEKVKIDYLREGRRQSATATLERRPEQTVAGTERRDEGVLDGVAVGDLTPQLRDQRQIPARIERAGVTRAEPASAAARQGLREGDVILEIGRKPVRSAGQAVERSGQIEGAQVLVRIWRDGRTRFIVVDEDSP